jgi:hypothetical protein
MDTRWRGRKTDTDYSANSQRLRRSTEFLNSGIAPDHSGSEVGPMILSEDERLGSNSRRRACHYFLFADKPPSGEPIPGL